MTTRTPSILIVGAGPTGLTAALELARRGIQPRIIDREAGPTPLSKAVGISPHSLDLLEASGVTSRLLAEGIRIAHLQVHYEDRPLGTIDISRLPHRFNFLLSLPQSDTENIMADVLARFGIRVERQTGLTGLSQDDERIQVSLEGPDRRTEATFDYVYGADGAHSTVREAAKLSFDGYVHHRVWSIADAEISGWPYEPQSAQLFLHEHGDIGFIIPIAGGRFRAISDTEDALAQVPGRYRVSKILRTGTFHIPVRQAAQYQKGRVFLGGDAAHVHSPVGARGMNLGIEDAASFARRFSENELAGYSAERHPIGRRWIALSERILSLATSESPTVVTLRNLAFRTVGHLTALQRPMLERVAGLRE